MQSRNIAWAMMLCAGVTGAATAGGEARRGVMEPPSDTKVAGTSINAMFNVRESVVTKLDVRGEVGQPFEFLVPIEDQVVMVQLDPVSLLSPDYKLRVQQADGSIVVVPTPPEITYQGTVQEIPGARVAASLFETGVEAQILMPDGKTYWIEPMGTRVEGAGADDYIVYRGTDAMGWGATCGVTPEMEQAALNDPERQAAPGERGSGVSNCGDATPCIAQLAVDADFTYFTARGGTVAAVQNRVNSVINLTNVQYQAQVGITHQIVTIIVRSAEPDPYQGPSINTLLSQLSNEWQTTQAGIVRDVVQLFTAEPTGSTIGLAFLSSVCNNSLHYSVVQSDCCGSLNCAADLSAHELGHSWSASHCSCPASTMNPTIACALTFLNNPDSANNSQQQIINFRNGRSCLTASESGTTTLPIVDNFDSSTTIDSMIWTGVDTGVTINAFAFNEPSAPNALDIKGTRQIRTAIVNASQISDIMVQFQTQAGGSLNPPESGESLVVEWLDSTGTWQLALTVPTNGAAQTVFTPQSVTLPAGASHSGLRIRFRNTANSTAGDDWFIDNVNITGMAAVPGPFNLLLPANGATGVSQSPFFDWSNSFAANDYRIMVDDDPNFGSPRFNELTFGLSSYSTAGNPLNAATVYYWKVFAINPQGQTQGTPLVASFTTTGNPPGPFTLLLPANGAYYDTPANIEFAWATSAQANSYRLQIDNSGPTFPSPEIDIPNITVLGYTISTASLANGSYRWRVIASNALGTQVSSTTRTFDIDITPPAVPGDTNCDGVTNAGDCASFALALSDPSGYAAQFPGCDIMRADINGDSLVNAADRPGMCALVPSCFFCQVPASGDMNCDGQVNEADCPLFQLALSDPAGYAAQYPLCPITSGDFTGDGMVTAADQNGFCAALPSCPFCKQTPCPGDTTGDGMVGLADIAPILTCWTMPASCNPPADHDGSGTIDLGDIAVVLSNWGLTCR